MKKYVFLLGMVALMSSCNGDIYDNIKEFVDSETVYPAGYDQTKVSLMSGYDRVEIYLMGDNRVEKPHLAKAIKTVVKWGEGPNEKREFTPARSWVNVTGLTVAQVYHFAIYTEDEFGNTSAPVTISGKPFTEADKGAYTILTSFVATSSAAAIACTTTPSLFTFCSVDYSYTDKDAIEQVKNSESPNFTVRNLRAGEYTEVNLSYKILLNDVADTVVIDDVLTVRTELTDPPPFNIALRKPLSALTVSGILNNNTAAFSPSCAVDGNRQTNIINTANVFWASEDTFNEHWFEIDLQGTFEISALTLWRSTTNNVQRRTQKFSFQVWVDGAWVDVCSEENNVDWPYQNNFTPVLTTKVRWYVPPYTDNRTFLCEIEVWGIIG